jgi:ribosomal-protein-alanine N-acetyltransferase
MIKLRDARSEDLDAVMEIMSAAFDPKYGEAWTRSQCAGILPMEGVRMMLAQDEEDPRPCGFSLYRTIAGDSELLLLAVSPRAQKQGIGRLLLSEFIEASKRCGADRIHLEVRDDNSAIELYRSKGFMPAGRRRKYYRGRDGEARDALTFVLKVDI